ncbi:hypothetical protein K490DRAFT_45722 [Saccharata proteae CBS 121410]|uniref:Spermatogenesis-associated protein 20-like TRX domain-containing protein n=1 Tax=Saccharata proteae CBS 121410 TaxID=1314787 RepID=A0A9P4HUZ4_9PEZI|nr:hypothetical protein K490DRAFT_45722 [Saccharata proteae CBS 121410]
MDVQDLSVGSSQPGDLKLTNRLNESRSPYVRGHMNNPVAWQMWDDEAIALAKKTNRLLFVSIGYAACHWCHVMERESFENREVANVLNKNFIPIKVDREERPDVDRIYMNYVQATTGSGGWPLNVFITPDLEPIFGGTYFPGPESATVHGDHVGFLDILQKIGDVWKNQKQRCLESAKEITTQLREFAQEGLISKNGEGETGDGLELELLDDAYEHFAAKFDSQNGGFGRAPKFPTPVNLSFLLRLGQYPNTVKDVVGPEECGNAKMMAVETLRAMYRGGIHDQIGNGFARYSVTQDWSLPHFEKMLYDQPQLLNSYLDAYLITNDPEMLSAVHDIATYLTSPPMCSPEGGFFSAEDADSLYRPNDKEKREGAFYVWTLKEFQQVLGERDAEILAKYYNVQENGNVSPEHDAHDELINQNVLAISSTPETLAKEFGMSTDEINHILKQGREKLREHREKERPKPSLDDKIVVSWNGLAIGALARASAVLSSLPASSTNDTTSNTAAAQRYLTAATSAVTFIRRNLYNPSTHTLTRVYRHGPGTAPAFADDYAFLISGLLDLYTATFDASHLRLADTLQRSQNSLFWDKSGGGFFSTMEGQKDLILRLKDGMDNAEPSTNGVSAGNLLRLGSLLGDEGYVAMARATAEAFEAEVMQHPFLFSSLLDAVVGLREGVRGVVVRGPEGEETEKVVRGLRKGVSGAGVTVLRVREGVEGDRWVRDRNEIVGKADWGRVGVMVCEGGSCREEGLDGEGAGMGMEELVRGVREMR